MEHPRLQIVLLHGITGSRRFFSWLEDKLGLAPIFAATYSFDLLGFGDNKNTLSEFTPAEQLRWIEDSISERFPAGKVVLVGHSMGGLLSLAWAADHLSRVSRIVLLNAPLGENREDIVHSLTQDHIGWATLLLKYKPFAHLACVVLRGVHAYRALHFAKPDYVPDEVLLDYTKHIWKSLARTFDGILLGLPGMPLVRRIEEIPILNLTGVDDNEISRRTIDQPNVENVKLSGGHLMLLEHPEETFTAVVRFLLRDFSSSATRGQPRLSGFKSPVRAPGPQRALNS